MKGIYLLAGKGCAEERRIAAGRLRERGAGVIDIGEIGCKNIKKLSALLFACDGLALAGDFRGDELGMECLRLASRLGLEILEAGEIPPG